MKYTDGVVLIQIRDSAAAAAPDELDVPPSPIDRFSRAISFVTNPFVSTRARNATTAIRNDEQIGMVGDHFRDLGCSSDFFKTFIFDFRDSDNVAISWRY